MPYLIYKKCYNKKPYKFYLKHMYYIIITIITYIICYKIISFINITGLMGLILKSITIVILSNILLVLFIFKTNEFKERLAKGETLDDLLPEAFATAYLNVIYDTSALELTNVSYDNYLFGKGSCMPNVNSNLITFVRATNVTDSNGILCTITFKVKETATSNLLL